MIKVISKNLFRIISSFLVVCILALGALNYIGDATVVEAKTISELEKEQAALARKKKEINNKLNSTAAKIKNEKEKQVLLDRQIKSVEEQIGLYQDKITFVTGQIATKENEIKLKMADIEVNQELFAQRVKAMYISRTSSSVLSTLLESKSFSQFINNKEILSRISNSDKDLIDNLSTQKKDLDSRKADLLANQNDLKKTKTAFDAKNKSLDSLYSQSKGAEAEARKNEKALWLLMEKNKSDSAKVENQLNEAIAAAKNNGSAPQGQLLWPLPIRTYISSHYGWRTLYGRKDLHTGIDLPAPKGTSIFAAEDGEVILAQKSGSSYGWHVVINHNGGLVTIYGHMSRIDVSVGQTVKRGDTIGGVGTTGNSTGNHLHFEVRLNQVRQNPLNYVRQP